MEIKGVIFALSGILILVISLVVLVVDQETFLAILRILVFLSLLTISLIILIISHKLLTLKPPPPAA